MLMGINIDVQIQLGNVHCNCNFFRFLTIFSMDGDINNNQLRATSHYGRRSRVRRFPPIIIQKITWMDSRAFTLRGTTFGHHPQNWQNVREISTKSVHGDGLSTMV